MKFFRDNRGSVLLEAIICLPLLLLVSLGTLQFAQIWLCRQVVQYAAFSAARATLPVHADEESEAAFYSARRICAAAAFLGRPQQDMRRSWLSRSWKPSWVPEISATTLPGSGDLSDTPVLQPDGMLKNSKLGVEVTVPSGQQWLRQITIQLDVPLLVPVAGAAIGREFSKWNQLQPSPHGTNSMVIIHHGLFPHVRLYGTAVIAKPFVITTHENLPDTIRTYE